MADPKPIAGLDWLNAVIGGLAQANVAIPIIFSTVTSMAQLYRAARGEAPLTPEELFTIADQIEAQVAKNDAYGKGEIARLQLLIEKRAVARAAGEPLPVSTDVPSAPSTAPGQPVP